MNLIEDTSDREVKFLQADLLMEEHRMEEAETIYQELAKSENESFEVLLDIALNYMDANQGDYTAKWLAFESRSSAILSRMPPKASQEPSNGRISGKYS